MRVTSEDWLQAQHSVLGAALIDEKTAVRILSETEESDYSGAGKTVFNAMHALFSQGKPVDPVSVVSELGTEYRSFVMQLMDLSPTAANVDHHIRLCREQAKVLSVQEIAQQLTQAETPEQVRQLLEQANGCMVSRQRWKSSTMSDALHAFMENYNVRPDFLKWPFPGFGDHLRVRPGRFIIVGAEPSVGKTAFSIQCAWHWAKDKKVGFFSLETDKDTLMERLISMLMQIPLSRIQDKNLSEQDWERLCQATAEISQAPLEFIQASGMTTADIRAKILESGYQIIIIDYLQLMRARGGSRYEQVTNISLDLHTIAQSLGVTVVALSQLSRSTDDHTPKNSDLRESGQLEQDADVILMMKLDKQSEPAGPRKIFVTKNKEGELFMSLLAFDGKHQTFSKVQRTGNAVGKFVHDGNKARQKSKTEAQAEAQMTMLPNDYPVPF